MKSSFFVDQEKLERCTMVKASMNSQEGVFLYGLADKSICKLLPPPIESIDPEHPIVYLYIVSIREPSFAPWYREGGIGMLAKYGEKTGVYFFNNQLCGPGALAGAYLGREGAGLPKKLCERIVVERVDDWGHCFIERNGVRLVDVGLKMGSYNETTYNSGLEDCREKEGGVLSGGGCLLHTYRMGKEGFTDLELVYYNSPTRYYSWDPATATVNLQSSIDDPWGEIPLLQVLGAAWATCDNFVTDLSCLYKYPESEVLRAMQYLFTGRYDRGVICDAHQRYG